MIASQNSTRFRTLDLKYPQAFTTYRSIGGYDQWGRILREKPDPKIIIEALKAVKAVIPDGFSVPVVPGEIMVETDTNYDSLAKAGCMLGSGAVIVIAGGICVVRNGRSMVEAARGLWSEEASNGDLFVNELLRSTEVTPL